MNEINPQTRTRFAPSPTGFMHVGNLRTALYAYLLAKSQGGKFILRIEDTDQARYVDGAVRVIYDTLKTAGLQHDEGPDVGGGCGPYIQSERREIYRKYALELVARGGAYYCFCEKSGEEPEDASSDDPALGCGGGCRELDAAGIDARLAAGAPYVIRQKIDRSGSTTFRDAVFGEITIENKVLDDQILLKSDGMPTYNFANVIDDHLMGITHVVRGSEYLPSTPKYNMLYRAFGWEIPQYVHLPLIMGRNADGEIAKLSKRHGSVSFENLLQDGFLPQAVVNYIALLGWSPKSDRELFTLAELTELFNVAGLNKSPAVFDYDKLRWMNGEYLKQLSPEEFARLSRPFAGEEIGSLDANWPTAAALLQARIETFAEIPEKIAFLLKQPEYETELFRNKKSKCDPAAAAAILAEYQPLLETLPEWSLTSLSDGISRRIAETGANMRQVMWALRIAVSGLSVTPGGAAEILFLLGREEALRRIRNAREKLSGC